MVTLAHSMFDGQARVNRQLRKTPATRKTKGSRKLEGGSCIARMMVSENKQTGVVTIDYVSTHTGHKPSLDECKYLPLPTSLRREVQEKFSAGVTVERIMNGKCFLCLLNILAWSWMYRHSGTNRGSCSPLPLQTKSQ